MNVRTLYLPMLFLVACDVSGEGRVLQDEGLEEPASLSINSSSGTLADIYVGMKESDLLTLGYQSSRRNVVIESDNYTVIDVALEKDVTVECVIYSGELVEFSASSTKMRDERNIGVGSKLHELERAYPNGRLLVGDEDGRYANFVNGTRVVFELSQAAIDLHCFEPHKSNCEIDPNTEVVRVVVNSGPAG